MANGKNGKNNLCMWISCLAVLATLGVVVAVMLRQNKCCGKQGYTRREREGYQEYRGGFSGTTACGEWI